MKISASEDIAAPAEEVFAALTDFDRFERMALRRGARLSRLDALEGPGAGMVWRIEFTFRGRERRARTELAEYEPPGRLRYDSHVGGFSSVTEIEVMALSPRRSRLRLSIESHASSVPARLFLQSLRLAKPALRRRLQKRLGQLGRRIDGLPGALPDQPRRGSAG